MIRFAPFVLLAAIAAATPASAQTVTVRTDDMDRIAECIAAVQRSNRMEQDRNGHDLDGAAALEQSWIDRASELAVDRGVDPAVFAAEVRRRYREMGDSQAISQWARCRSGR